MFKHGFRNALKLRKSTSSADLDHSGDEDQSATSSFPHNGDTSSIYKPTFGVSHGQTASTSEPDSQSNNPFFSFMTHRHQASEKENLKPMFEEDAEDLETVLAHGKPEEDDSGDEMVSIRNAFKPINRLLAMPTNDKQPLQQQSMEDPAEPGPSTSPNQITAPKTLRVKPNNSTFPNFLNNLAGLHLADGQPKKSPAPPPSNQDDEDNAESTDDSMPIDKSASPISPLQDSSSSSPTSSVPDDDGEPKRKKKRPLDTFAMLQPIVESSTSFAFKPSNSPFSASILGGVDLSYAKRMEEIGRLRRMESQITVGAVPSDEAGSTSTTTIQEPPPPNPKPQVVATPADVVKPPDDGYDDMQLDQPSPLTHSKALSEGDTPRKKPSLPPTPPPKSPKKVLSPITEEPKPFLSSDRPLSPANIALQERLDRVLLQLRNVEAEKERIRIHANKEKERIYNELEFRMSEIAELEKDNLAQSQKIENLEIQLSKTEQHHQALAKEKQSWQEQLDTMHHKLTRAERQVRHLDHVTRAKVEARQEGVFGMVRRSKKSLSASDPSTEVIHAVMSLNEEILQAANLLVENLEKATVITLPSDVIKARSILGNGVVSMMEDQVSMKKGFHFLLMQVVLEAFMVHWCSSIIEAWYPKQTTFSDLLIELNAQKSTTTVAGSQTQLCGRHFQILQIGATSAPPVKFEDWVTEIQDELSKVLLVGGLRIKPKKALSVTSNLHSLVKMAYNVRTALAEKDIVGGLELVVVGPDTPFQHRWMDEAHALTRNNANVVFQTELVSGTSGMGLQRNYDHSPSWGGGMPTMVLKPKVVLARVLRESP